MRTRGVNLRANLTTLPQTYLKLMICHAELTVTKLSDFRTKTRGPGSRNSGKKQQNAKLSCSKNVNSPSSDCTHIKSLLWLPPKGPTKKLCADLRNLCSYNNCRMCCTPVDSIKINSKNVHYHRQVYLPWSVAPSLVTRA